MKKTLDEHLASIMECRVTGSIYGIKLLCGCKFTFYPEGTGFIYRRNGAKGAIRAYTRNKQPELYPKACGHFPGRLTPKDVSDFLRGLGSAELK